MCIILMMPLLSTMRIENIEFTIHNSKFKIQYRYDETTERRSMRHEGKNMAGG